MAGHFLAVAVFAVLAVYTSGQPQPYFSCPNDGPFPDTDDCSKFFQCFQGMASHQNCPMGLEFNPANGWCDYPAMVSGSGCRKIALSSDVNSPCLVNGNIKDAEFVPHPSFCNAFFSCGNGFLYPQCTFCGEGSYFDVKVNHCVSSMGLDIRAECAGRDLVHPTLQEIRRLEASCHPGQNDSYAPLLAKIRH